MAQATASASSRPRSAIDREREYAPAEAVALVKQLASAKFDESVEVHVRTGLNVRHADEQLRGTIALPNGTRQGRHDRRVRAGRQGARGRGGRRRLRRRRGPRQAHPGGLRRLRRRDRDARHDADRRPPRPHPRARPARCPTRRSARSRWTSRKAVEESKSGKVEYRTDRSAIVHLMIGKASFEDRTLLENYAAVLEELVRAKPSAAKGRYLRRSRSPRRWAPASRSTPAAPVTSSRRRRRPRPLAERPPNRRPQTPGGRACAAEARDRSPMNRDQKAVAIAEIAEEIAGVRGDLRRRLPRHHRRAGGRAARQAARLRRVFQGRQELADRARRRPGRSRSCRRSTSPGPPR